MGCDKNSTLLLPFPLKMHYPTLTIEITSEKYPQKEMLQNMLKTYKLKKKARNVWETMTPKGTRSKYNVLFWNKRKCISES